MNALKDIFRKYLKESALLLERNGFPTDKEIAGCPSIYKVVRSSEKDSFITVGFNKTLAAEAQRNGTGRGTAAGEGIYSSIKLGGRNGAARLAGSHYGDVIIQGKMLGGFERFIMFNGDMFKEIGYMIERYYGKKKDGTLYTPYEQCLKLTNDRELAALIDRYGVNTNSSYSYWGGGSESVKKLRRAGIRGFLYEFDNGPTALPLDWGSVIPFAYADNVYRGEDEDSIRRRMKPCYPSYTNSKGQVIDTKEVYENMCDWTFQLDGFYDDYDKTSIKEFNGESYCAVYIRNRGWNIVQIDRANYAHPQAKEMLPMWLPEQPSKVSMEGVFAFKYGGREWQAAISLPDCNSACLWYPEDISEFSSPADVNSSNDWIPFSEKNLNGALMQIRAYKTVSESNIKNLFRKNLLQESFNFATEGDFLNSKQRMVYVCAHADAVSGIFKGGFSRQFANANDFMNNGGSLTYGDGQYGSVTLDNAKRLSFKQQYSKPDGYKYGPIILKCALLGGFYNFLIFDEKLAKYVYKDKWHIEDQIDYIIKDPKGNQELKDYCKRFSGYELYNPSGDSYRRTNHIIFNMFSWQAEAKKWMNFFRKYGIRGAVYHGHGDGYCFVCYNYSELIPIEASYDHGDSFSTTDEKGNKLFNFDVVKERLFMDNDPVQRFGHLYAEVSDKPRLCQINGKRFSVTTVKTFDGGYNIILTNSKKGDKISKYDFDTVPSIGSDGIFAFKYKGKTFNGIINLPGDNVPAIWFPEDSSLLYQMPDIESGDDWVTFDYLPMLIQQV